MNISLSRGDVIWSYIGTIMSMASNLLMLPFIISYLDDDMLGLWYVFTSIGGIAALFDFGFSVTFARNITYCWSGADSLKKEDVGFNNRTEPNYELMKKVLSSCKVIYLIISSVGLLLMLSAGTAYIAYISRDISGYKHFIAWLIYSFAVFLNLYYGYYSSFLRGVGAVGAANKNTVIARLAQFVVMVILLFAGFGIIGASLAYLVYGTLFRILGKHKFYNYKNIKKGLSRIKKKIDKAELREVFVTVWHNAWRDGVIALCNYFCNQSSTLICSLYLSLPETGVYSIGVQVASAIAQIAGTLYTAYQPALQASYVSRNKNMQREIMSVIVVSFILLFVMGTVGVIVVVIPFLNIIRPDIIFSIPVLLGLCLYQFMLKFRNCYTSYFSCTNRIVYLKGFVASAALCIALSLFMTGNLKTGVYGLIGAQIISQSVYNFWKWPLKAHYELELRASEMARLGIAHLKSEISNFFAK